MMAAELYAMFGGLDLAAWAAALVCNRPAALCGVVRAGGRVAVVGLASAQSVVVSPARRRICGLENRKRDLRCG